MMSIMRYVYDIFGWSYRDCKFLNDKFLVDTFYYDLNEEIQNKYGQFMPPLTTQVVHDKHVLISYFEIDNATALSPYKLEFKNKDINGTEHKQDLTLKEGEELLSEPSKHEKEKVEEYTQTKIGALPLLCCKLNPYYYESQMNVKSMKELKKSTQGLLSGVSFSQIVFYGGIALVGLVILWAFYTGKIHL